TQLTSAHPRQALPVQDLPSSGTYPVALAKSSLLRNLSISCCRNLRCSGLIMLSCFSLIRRTWCACHSCQACCDTWFMMSSPLGPGNGGTSMPSISFWYLRQNTLRGIGLLVVIHLEGE